MLKVLLADDEAKVLRHLQTAIPWLQLGLEIAGTAQTGAEALSLARRLPVDVVITDIRMPGMDGLALCQKLREQNPRTQLIILSGYQDFAYAKKAIELQVLGYCLKPIDTGDLIGLLRAAVRSALQSKASDGDALLDLIEDGAPHEVRAAFRELGLCSAGVHVAASVGVHNIEKPLAAQLSYKLGKHKYLYFSSRPFDRAAAERIIAYAEGRGGIGMPPEPCGFERLNGAVENALAMAFQFFVSGRPTLCGSLVAGPLADEAFARLESASQHPGQLKALLEELTHADCSLIFNIQSAFVFCNRVAACPAFGGAAEHGERMLYGFEQLAADHENLSCLLQSLAAEISPAALPRPEPAPSGASGSFLPILRYLEENYEKDLSLKKIAEHFHLNACYVSQLIRGETGLTYTQYVTELRINKAKELLKTTSLSLAEISEAVGFNDYFYFIKTFKKEVGVTPGKYLP